MSVVGKLLVFLQVALSFVFMAVAGAVYTSHTNWMKVANTTKKQLQDEQRKVADVTSNAEAEKTALTTQMTAEKDLRLKAEADLEIANTELAALKKDKIDLASQIATQTAIAETKSSEAGFRNEEALQQRTINSDLQKRNDAQMQDLRLANDELFSTRTELGDLKVRYNRLLGEKADLEKILAQANINFDPRQLARMQAPAPVVDGLVLEVRKDRTNRASMLVITIGADDGLVKGHELDAYRSGVNGEQPQWLGRIRVVSTTPNEAVCEVMDAAKNGIIKVGDNVTTKLL